MKSRGATGPYLGISLSFFALTLRLKNRCLCIDLTYLLTGFASFFGFLEDKSKSALSCRIALGYAPRHTPSQHLARIS